jgi:hypothetical protein
MQPAQRPAGFGMNQLSRGQLILGISSLALLILLFLPWRTARVFGFEVQGINQNGIGTGIGWFVLLLILGLFVWEGLLMGGVIKGNFNGALISAAIGGGIAVFGLITFFISLTGLKIGAILGLVAILGVAFGAWLRYNESRTTAPPPGAPPPSAPPPAAPPPA